MICFLKEAYHSFVKMHIMTGWHKENGFLVFDDQKFNDFPFPSPPPPPTSYSVEEICYPQRTQRRKYAFWAISLNKILILYSGHPIISWLFFVTPYSSWNCSVTLALEPPIQKEMIAPLVHCKASNLVKW